MGQVKKEEVAAILEKIDAEEVIIRTIEEEKEFTDNILKNAVEPEIDKRIGERISEIHTRYDNDIFTITGLKKEPNQKTYEFNKEVLTKLTQEKKRYGDLQREHEKLKELKSKGSDDTLKELESVKEQARLAQEKADKKRQEEEN